MTNISPVFRKVLIAADFSASSNAAFHAALSLSRQLQAKLLILHVRDSILPAVEDRLFDPVHCLADARKALDHLLSQACANELECEARIEAGSPAEVILDTIRRECIDVAVLGTRAIHGIERFIFGSTAEEVLRHACCPVLTVGPQATACPSSADGTVVFATDFHLTTTHAISYAASLSSSTKAHLHCLHVLPRSFESGGNSEIIPHILTEALQHVAQENGVVFLQPVYSVAYGSEISNAIVEYARIHKARWIVLGVRRASMMTAHTPAHIAYRVIAEAPCPVLTMAFPSEAPNTLGSHASETKC